MKRDMDLVRDILLAIEADDPDSSEAMLTGKPGFADEEKLNAHLFMLIDEAGLVDGVNVGSYDGDAWIDLRLTWRGHEYVETIRDPEVWKLTKAGAQKAGGFTIDLLAALAKGFLKKKIEAATGIQIEL